MSEFNSALLGAVIGAIAGSFVSGYYQTRAAHEQAELEIIKAATQQPGTTPDQAVRNLLFWQDVGVIKLSVAPDAVLKACRERLGAKNCPVQ